MHISFLHYVLNWVIKLNIAGFEVFMLVIMNSAIMWDVVPTVTLFSLTDSLYPEDGGDMFL
jgi:hypothetical protein